MNKKILLLILGLALANMVFADVSFSISFNSSETLKVFTSQYIADQTPAPVFSDTLIVLSSFQPGRQEFLVFGNIINGENVLIENGVWETKKNTLGMGFGKVLTIPVHLTKMGLEFSLDFSAGPYFHIFLSNHYTHVSGQYKREVETASILHRVQYGLYATTRLRLTHYKKYFNAVDFNLGLHFFMPFSNHEFNDDAKARYHLFKTFAFLGISF
ncbi:MAG: hypothetical protein KJ808_04395 [Acidobacteria bacterium]|nr:hypothetical protein [Acidobacteriota bacterium]MBU4307797.1 hypothetical protein [Acidobacteriota bacterium]MCG2811553.1 hypothetical protein [Candidatus Aminicenantes bacterium]